MGAWRDVSVVRPFAAPAEDLCASPSTTWWLTTLSVTPVPGDRIPSSGLCEHQAGIHMHIK